MVHPHSTTPIPDWLLISGLSFYSWYFDVDHIFFAIFFSNREPVKTLFADVVHKRLPPALSLCGTIFKEKRVANCRDPSLCKDHHRKVISHGVFLKRASLINRATNVIYWPTFLKTKIADLGCPPPFCGLNPQISICRASLSLAWISKVHICFQF